MLTHRNLVANVAQNEVILGKLGENERVMAVLPFSHIYGLNVLMNLTLSVGATLVTLPRFDLEQFLRTIQDQKITRAFVVPPIVVAIVKHPLAERFDVSSLRTMMLGPQWDASHQSSSYRFWRVACPVPIVRKNEDGSEDIIAWKLPDCGHRDTVVCEVDTTI